MSDRNAGGNRMDNVIERLKISTSRSARHLPALVAAGVGLLLSLIGAYAVGRWEQRVTKVEFEGVAATELIVLQNGINEYLSRLVTLRTLFESTNEEITRSEFEVFSGRLFEYHPGLLRVGWLPSVAWMRSRASRTGSISDWPRGESSMSRPTRTSRGSPK